MKKLFLQSLLAVAGLLVGSSAWAATKTLYAQNFDGESAVPAGWTQANGTLSLEVDGTNKWLRETTSGNGSREAWYTGDDIRNAIGEYTTYTLEFDCKIQEGTNTTNYAQGVWVLGTSLSNSWGTPSNPIVGVLKGSKQSTYTVYANMAATETTVNLVSGTWYHYVVAYDQTTKKLTFSILSQDQNSTVLAATEFDYDYEDAQGTFKSIAFQAGRGGSGHTELDNILLSTEVAGDVANEPSIVETAVQGADRQYTITFDDGETLHYTVPGGEEATATVSPLVLTVTAAGTLSAYTTKGSATSETVEATVTHGAITLNAPTYTINMAATNGIYHPTYSFASNQGNIENAPAATLSYVFAGGASTAGNSYAPASAGTLTITASAEGYTSASTVINVVNTDFYKTYTFDATAIVKAEDAGTDGGSTTVNGAGCNFYKLSDCTYEVREDITFSGLSFAWAITANEAKGLAPRSGSGTITFSLDEGELIEFVGQNATRTSEATSYTVAALTLVSSINIYTPVTSVSATIGATGYTTFASSFALNLDELPTGLEAYYIKSDGVQDGYVTLTAATGNVEAGTGLLLKGTASTPYEISLAASGSALDGNLLKGVTAATDVVAAENKYVLVNNGGTAEFQSLKTNGASIPAGKAYLEVPVATPDPSANLRIVFGDEATAISVLNAAKAENDVLYNVAGQRVSDSYKGIVIKNGKKYLNK